MKFNFLSLAFLLLFYSCSSNNKEASPVTKEEVTEDVVQDEKAVYADDNSKISDGSAQTFAASTVSYAAEDKKLLPEVNNSTPADNVKFAASPSVEKKIIKNAVMKFQVKELKKSSTTIEALAKKYGAYVASSNQGNNYGTIYNTISIRVPAARFEELLNEVEKESIYIDSKNISSQDVTEEYVDIETRIKTKKEVEQQYKAILLKAKSIDEILAVQAQIGQIREEIEAKEGRLKFLADNVLYSTVNVELYETVSGQVQPENGFFARLGTALGGGWEGLLSFFIGVISIWPFWLVLTTGLLLVRRWWKRRK